MAQESAIDLERRLAQAQRELSEAREQQAATAKVLRIISSSPGKLEPVFETILANATRICEAKFGNLLLYEGAAFRRVALYNAPREWGELTQRNPTIHPGPKDPSSAWSRRSSCNISPTSGRSRPTLSASPRL